MCRKNLKITGYNTGYLTCSQCVPPLCSPTDTSSPTKPQVPSHSKPKQTWLMLHIPPPPALQICPLHYALTRPYPKWYHKPGIMQEAPARTPTMGTGEDSHTHQSDCSPNSGLGADIWSDSRPCPPMKATQGTTQGKCLAVWRYHLSGECLVWLSSSLRQLQNGPQTTEGPNPTHNSQRAITIDWTDAKAAQPQQKGIHSTHRRCPWRSEILWTGDIAL